MGNKASHYLYMLDACEATRRVVFSGIDLSDASMNTRRDILHQAMEEGYLIAKCPEDCCLQVGNINIHEFQDFLDSQKGDK